MELFLLLTGAVVFVFLIFKRLEDKKKENFEDREN
jgi:hypothetical protein